MPPDCVRGSILPFMSLRDLIKLDSAVNCRADRIYLHDVYSKHCLIAKARVALKLKMFKWLDSRNMYVENFEYQDRHCDLEPLGLLHRLKYVRRLAYYGGFLSNVELMQTVESIQANYLVDLSFYGMMGCDLDPIFRKQKLIQRIKIYNLTNITDTVMRCIASHFHFLREFTICDCPNVIFRGEAVLELCVSCPMLRVIRICSHHSLDAALLQIGTHCGSLEELHVSLCDEVRDHSLVPVLKGCHKLRVLDLSATSVTHVGFAQIAHNCNSLEDLELDIRCEDVSVVNGFGVLGSSLSSFAGWMYSGTAALSAKQWGSRMKSIYLTERAVTNELVTSIARYCCNLVDLEVFDRCGHLSDISLESLAVGTMHLQVLKINGGQNISDRGVVALSRGCTRLELLRLSSSTTLQSESILHLKVNCPRIQRIELKAFADFSLINKCVFVPGCAYF